MIRVWLAFFIIAGVIHFTIQTWRTMSGLEKWSLTKTAFYSIIVSLLTVVVMSLIVILF